MCVDPYGEEVIFGDDNEGLTWVITRASGAREAS